MAGVSELPDPTSLEFQHYSSSVPPSRILIGWAFLAECYYENHRNDEQRLKYEYGQELLLEIEEGEIPFSKIIVTWHTLATVVAHLSSGWLQEAACNCLTHFSEQDSHLIRYPGQSIYKESIDMYRNFTEDRPNLHEVADCLYMCETSPVRHVRRGRVARHIAARRRLHRTHHVLPGDARNRLGPDRDRAHNPPARHRRRPVGRRLRHRRVRDRAGIQRSSAELSDGEGRSLPRAVLG